MNNIYKPEIYSKYPDYEHGHMFPCKIKKEYVYDESYEYRVKSIHRKVLRFFVELFLWILGPILTFFKFYPKYKNKKVLKNHKQELKNGFITMSNHVFPWDNIVLRNIRKFRRVEMPIWKEGAESNAGSLYRLSGGITVPQNSKGILASYKAMDDVIKEKKWLHVYPEAACWEYYCPIRDFKTGTFKIAVDHNVPIFPIAYSFRPAKGIFKLWKGKRPLVNVSLGEPLYPDLTLTRKNAVIDLCMRVQKACAKLAGFDSIEENNEFKKTYSYYPYVNPYINEYERLRNKGRNS